MLNAIKGETATAPSIVGDVTERVENGLTILSPRHGKPSRRVLYINTYGGAETWRKVKSGLTPTQHLWGCVELARQGYEVALAEPMIHFYHRRPFPHDLPLFRWARHWLGPDDILYCGHTLLYWVGLLRRLHMARFHLVSLTYARERLDFARAHSAIIALTPTAAEEARKHAPRAKVAHLGWGSDLSFFPRLPYQPEWFLSCGLTHRDHPTLSRAAAHTAAGVRVVSPYIPPELTWTENVKLITGGRHDDTMSHRELLNENYRRCAASLIILKRDPAHNTAVGFTNLIEAMSMARPVIVTRTGALESEIDVEKAGCGLHVPPDDPAALAAAITTLANDRAKAEAMGQVGRRLVESHYNMGRFSDQLHALFASL